MPNEITSTLDQRTTLTAEHIVNGLLERAEQVGQLVGKPAARLVRQATGNQHLFERITRKGTDLASDVKKIDDHLTAVETEFHDAQKES